MIALPQIKLENPVLTPRTWDTKSITDPLEQYIQEENRKNDAIEKQKRQEILQYGMYAVDPIKFKSVKLQEDAIKDRDTWMGNAATTFSKYKGRGKEIPATELVRLQTELKLINDKINLNNSIQKQAEDAAARLVEDFNGRRFNHDETRKSLDDWQKNGYYDPANGFLRDADANVPAILQSTKAARTTASKSEIVGYNKTTGEYTVKSSSYEGDENQCREIYRTVISIDPTVQKKAVKEWAKIEQDAAINPNAKLPELGNRTLGEYKQAYTSWASNNPQLDLGIAAKYGEDKDWPQARLNVKESEIERMRGGANGINIGGVSYRTITPQYGGIEGKYGMPMQLFNRVERPDLSNVGGNYIDPKTGQTEYVETGTSKQLYGFNLYRGEKNDKGYYAIVVKKPGDIKFQSGADGLPIIFNKETGTGVLDKEVGGKTARVEGAGKLAKPRYDHIVIGDKQYPDLKTAQYAIKENPSLANDIKLVTTEGGVDVLTIPLEVKKVPGSGSEQEKVLYKKIETNAELDMVTTNHSARVLYNALPEPVEQTEKENPKEKTQKKPEKPIKETSPNFKGDIVQQGGINYKWNYTAKKYEELK